MQPWTVISAQEYQDMLKAQMNLIAGQELDYNGTPEGAWVALIADMAFLMDFGMQQALSSMYLSSAVPTVLARVAESRGTQFKAGSHSVYIVRVNKGSGEIQEGSLLSDPNGQTWVTTQTTQVIPGTNIEVQAQEIGPVTLNSGAELTMITPNPKSFLITYLQGTGSRVTLGTNAETPQELRARLDQSATMVGGLTGLKARILGLPWVEAVDVRPGQNGAILVSVAPKALGADREQELGNILYDASMTGFTFGSEHIVITDANNQPYTVMYSPGTVIQTVYSVGFTHTGSDQAVKDSIAASLKAYTDSLALGQPINRLDVLTACNVPGVVSITSLEVNGSTQDQVFPAMQTDQFVYNSVVWL